MIRQIWPVVEGRNPERYRVGLALQIGGVMPKERIVLRDGAEILVTFNDYAVQIGIDRKNPFVFNDFPGEEYTDLYASLTVEDITQLQKNLARVKRYLKKGS